LKNVFCILSDLFAVLVSESLDLRLIFPEHLLLVSVGTNRRLLLESTVGFCWDLSSALAVGSCWDRPSAFAGIDRKLQGELC
jgi:hypothetical protein